MTPKSLRLAAMTLLAVALLLSGWMLTMQPDPGPRRNTVSGHSETSRTFPDSAPQTAYGTLAFKRELRRGGERWLSARGRDADGLIAMWKITGDETLLQEAAKNFPNEPQVCLAMVRQCRNDPVAAKPWIMRFMQSSPADPTGLLLMSWCHVKSGKMADALANLTNTVAMPSRYRSSLREEGLLLREAALASGAGERDAARLAVELAVEHSPSQIWSNDVLQMVQLQLLGAQNANEEERRSTLADLATGLGGFLRKAPALSVSELSGARGLELMALRSALPLRAPVDHEQTIPALNDAWRVRQTVTSAGYLARASDEAVQEFAEIFLSDGEAAALDRMLALRQQQ